MAADFVAKQGDTAITWSDTLTYSDGSVVDLTGASVKFVMRSLTGTQPTTNLAATIVTAASGTVKYVPTATDTATAGIFQAYWQVTFSNSTIEVFPTVGELTVSIEENLTTPGGARLVGLGDAKEHLNIDKNDRTHDGELLRFIDGLTPVVESLTGPILQRACQEFYDGGSWAITTRHRPILAVSSVIEYRGLISYLLTQAPTPDAGTTYSYMWEASGRITRRTAGGGMSTFPAGENTVLIVYTAGFAQVPPNVRLGTLELVRVNYQQTQQAGWTRGAGAGVDDEMGQGQTMLGFFVPNRVRELLMPNRRFPSFA